MTPSPHRAIIGVPILVWIIPAVLSAIALAPMPYGYYQLLRVVVFGVGVYLAWAEYRSAKALTRWAAALSAMAFVFNPLLPIHLPREVWAFLNLGSAALLFGHMLATKLTRPSVRS